MRNALLLAVMTSLAALSGCATDTPTDTSNDDTHGFTRDDDGQAVAAHVSRLDEATQAFDHTLASDSVVADAAAVSCSGACNANVCVCNGDFNCCAVGCGICFVLAN